MLETEEINNTQEFYEAAKNHKAALEKSLASSQLGDNFRTSVGSMQETIRGSFPGEITIITGEQPYGALGKPKVLGKRVFSKAMALRNPDVTTIELFANHDLVGSEDGFYRMVIPTNGTSIGYATENLVATKMRGDGETASGLSLPNPQVGRQVLKVLSILPSHYSGKSPSTNTPRLNEAVAHEWANSYGVDPKANKTEPVYDPSITPANYADAHMNWLIQLEQRLGIGMDFVTREGEIDLALARNGGILAMQQIWKDGLNRLGENDYQPITLKLNREEAQKTPFNLAVNGRRLSTRFNERDDSLVDITNGDQATTVTMDEALSGKYDFSWRAVPRVVLYSLSGISGHITGGGSVYNADAARFLREFGLPYFPITHMNSRDEEECPVGVFQYSSVSSARKNEAAKGLVRAGKVSLLDLALSCDPDEAQKVVLRRLTESENFNTTDYITLQNREGDLPQ